jgi:hypothetical protein
MKKHAPLAAISESVGDALSAGSGIVHDLGTTAVERASEVASELPGTVTQLTKRAKRRVRPAKSKSRSPLWPILIAAAIATCVAVVAWRRRSNRADEQATSIPPRDYTDRATAAAVGT